MRGVRKYQHWAFSIVRGLMPRELSPLNTGMCQPSLVLEVPQAQGWWMCRATYGFITWAYEGKEVEVCSAGPPSQFFNLDG